MLGMRRLAVSFVLFYFKQLAKLRLLVERPKIVGVAGSSGKTSLSFLLEAILSADHKVKQSQGRNSETGIPFSILGLKTSSYSNFSWILLMIKAPFKVIFQKRADIFIAEMGIDSPVSPKNMGYLLSIVRPQISIMTSITYEHAIYFEKYVQGEKNRPKKILDLIAAEELRLLKSLSKDNIAVVNEDNDYIKKTLPLVAKTITISSKNKKADYFVKDTKNSLKEFEMEFSFGNKNYNLKINQPLPAHYAKTFLEAISVSFILGTSVKESIKIIQRRFILPPGRSTVLKGINNTLVIDSSYNNVASEPLIEFLELMSDISNGRRKVGILGDMREQGEIAKIEHERVAEEILKNLDFVILIGDSMQKYVSGILKQANFDYLAFSNFTQAKENILKSIKEKDLILVKSSQNQLFLERAVEMLLDNPLDKDLLCRRGEYWDKIRAETA